MPHLQTCKIKTQIANTLKHGGNYYMTTNPHTEGDNNIHTRHQQTEGRTLIMQFVDTQRMGHERCKTT